MIFFSILYSAGTIYILSISFFLAALAISAYFFRKEKGNGNAFRIAVVVPAHNEEKQITKAVQGIFAMDFPSDRFSVFVIADNCEDSTARLARASGARVFERFDPANRGKGQALDWFFKIHKDEFFSFDGVAVIDADTMPDKQFLKEISSSLAHSQVDAVQGFYGVSNMTDNWRTALSTAALNVFNHLRPAGLVTLGGTAMLKGNGMAFKTWIPLKYGWPAHSIAEDTEFSLILLLDDVLVHYNPDAIVRGEIASRKSQTKTQMRRWEGGRIQASLGFAPRLLISFLKKPNMKLLVGFLDQISIPLSIHILAILLLSGISWMAYPGLFPFYILAYLCIIFYVLSGQLQRDAPPIVFLYLVAAPIFIILKIPVYIKAFIARRSNAWEKTPRKTEICKKK